MPMFNKPELATPPVAKKELRPAVVVNDTRLRLKAAILTHMHHNFVSDNGVSLKGDYVSSLLSNLRYDGWKISGHLNDFQDRCAEMGFIVVHGTGNEWHNKPQYRGQWYEKKDWLKNGRKTIGKYQTFIAVEKGE